MTSKPDDDLANLMKRIADGPAAVAEPDKMPRPPRPIYRLTVDEPDDRSIVLIIRTSKDGVIRATIALPEWHELPEGWDGPHEMPAALKLADDYAEAYGYHAIAIDIESSQVWDEAWGTLDR